MSPRARIPGAVSPGRQLAGFIDRYDPAVAQARTPLPAAGRSTTIVKSVSAKQRPRRPTKAPTGAVRRKRSASIAPTRPLPHSTSRTRFGRSRSSGTVPRPRQPAAPSRGR